MPELPEVETIRRGLSPLLFGRRVTRVDIFSPRVVVGDQEAFRSHLVGQVLGEVARRGKYLLFPLGEGLLLGHLRMTGRLYVEGGDAPPDAYVRLRLGLDGGAQLTFRDVRQFGRFQYVAAGEPLPEALSALGPEPLTPSFTAAYLRGRLARRRAAVKALLLDQRVVAGLGNIYVDEALARSRLHPAKPAGDLTAAEVARLVRAVRAVLAKALAQGGTTFRDYRDADGRPGAFFSALAVYGRAGAPCRRCGTPIVYTKVAGRGTHLCPRCQGGGG